MSPSSLQPFVLLVLAHVAGGVGAGVTLATIRTAVRPYLQGRGTRSDSDALLAAAVERLADQGLVDQLGQRFLLVQTGEDWLRDALSLEALPRARVWITLRDVNVLATALGLPAPRGKDGARFRTAGGMRAALLRAHFDLPLAPYPTVTEAVKALAWKRAGHYLKRDLPTEVAGRCGTGPIIEVLAGDWVGGTRVRGLSKLAALITAQVTGAKRSDAASIRRAILSQWVQTETGIVEPPAAGEASLEAFATRVVDLARGLPTGRFGQDCVFIAAVFEAWRQHEATADEAAFKNRLARANNKGLLTLQRADLVGAMDPDLVRRSEVDYLGARFHFVRV